MRLAELIRRKSRTEIRQGGYLHVWKLGPFEKVVIRDIEQANDYLVRWNLRLPLGFSFKLHRILRPDLDRCAHDHPWSFLRMILWGGYEEEYGPDHKLVIRKPWRIDYCGPNFQHRITRLLKCESWTINFVWPSTSAWGFYTKSGWVPWQSFVAMAMSARVLWCADGTVLGGDDVQDAARSRPGAEGRGT